MFITKAPPVYFYFLYLRSFRITCLYAGSINTQEYRICRALSVDYKEIFLLGCVYYGLPSVISLKTKLFMHKKITKGTGRNGQYTGKVKMTELFNSSASVYFACENQIILSWTVTVGQIMTKINVSVLFRNGIDYAHLLTVVQRDNVSIFDRVCYISNLCQT